MLRLQIVYAIAKGRYEKLRYLVRLGLRKCKAWSANLSYLMRMVLRDRVGLKAMSPYWLGYYVENMLFLRIYQ